MECLSWIDDGKYTLTTVISKPARALEFEPLEARSTMKLPRDAFPYPQDPRSQPLAPSVSDGGYVYVQDMSGLIFAVPDGPHLHPKILGGGKPALYAGDLTIQAGKIVDVTNLSGTFQFDDEAGLLAVADQLRQQGLVVEIGAVRFFPSDGSNPVILE